MIALLSVLSYLRRHFVKVTWQSCASAMISIECDGLQTLGKRTHNAVRQSLSFVEWGVRDILSACQAPDPVFSVTHTQTPLTEMTPRARNCGFNFRCDDHRPRAILTMTLKDDVVPCSIYDWDLSDQRSRSISSSSLLWGFPRHFWTCKSFTLARKCYSDRQWRIAEKQWRRKRMTWLGDVLWSSCLSYLLRRSQHLAVVIFLELWSPQWLSGGKTVSAYNCLVMEDRGKLICRLCTTRSLLYCVIRLWWYSSLFYGETATKFQPVCKMPSGNINRYREFHFVTYIKQGFWNSPCSLFRKKARNLISEN